MKSATFLLVAFLILPLLRAQTPASSPERVTEITSDRLLFDYARKVAVFTGNVVVNDPDIQITADKLTVTLTSEDEVRQIDAEGRVVIKMEGLHSRSGRAVYTPADTKVVLSEDPQVSRPGSILTAGVIRYWREDNRLEADPPVRMINIQEDGRDRQLKL